MSTTTSQASSEDGKFMVPTTGRRCQTLSGLPMSTMMKSIHIMMAVMARSSPKRTISLIGLKWYTYAGTTRRTAAAATPTRNVKLDM